MLHSVVHTTTSRASLLSKINSKNYEVIEMNKIRLYTQLKNTWNITDFITKKSLSIPKKYNKRIEEIFSQQLKNLTTKEFEKRTFSIIKEVS